MPTWGPTIPGLVRAVFNANVVWEYEGTFEGVVGKFGGSESSKLVLGTVTGDSAECDRIAVIKDRTLAPSATDSWDLSGFSNVNPFGETFALTKVHGIFMFNRSNENSGSPNVIMLLRGKAGAAFSIGINGSNDTIRIGSPGFVCASSKQDWPVTAVTGDVYDVQNLDVTENALYDIAFVGKE